MSKNRMKMTWLILLFALPIFLSAQEGTKAETVTISGYLKDADSGETLIAATAYVKGSGIGAYSNEYGFYSISIAPGTYTLEFSYLGFETQTKEVNLTENTKLNIELLEKSDELIEVVITSEAEDENVVKTEMSTNKTQYQNDYEDARASWRSGCHS